MQIMQNQVQSLKSLGSAAAV